MDSMQLIRLFNIENIKGNQINFNLLNNTQMRISYISKTDSLKNIILNGKMKGNTFYTRKKSRNIVIPFIYMNRNMMKYYFALTTDGAVILHYKSINEGMILFFGAGNTYEHTMIFKSK